jgi:superfamily II DNA or RNA helicase
MQGFRGGVDRVKFDRNNTNFTLRLFEHFKKATWATAYDFLKYYQNLVRIFVSEVDVGARGVLIYQTMGMGKSMLAIAIAIDLIKDGRQVIMLLTKSLQDNMRETIHKYVTLRRTVDPTFYLCLMSPPDLERWINVNFSFVSMNASNMLKQMGKAAAGHAADEFDIVLEKKLGEVLKLPSLNGKLLIIDEAHNLFRAITNGSKNAIGLYDMVMGVADLRLMALTGTPIANDPFELVSCFNMLAGKVGRPILPESYKEFNKLFVDEATGTIKNKAKFQNRILGLVSYVSSTSTPGIAFDIKDPASKAEFPHENDLVVERVNMDPDQFVIYQLARDREMEEGSPGGFGGPSVRIVEAPAMTKPKSGAASTYRVKSRQLSNYCAPNGQREEKDPAKLSHVTSAKFERIYANIEKHDGQLGLVYSQFVGVGGLGSFSRFLDEHGWERVGGLPTSDEPPPADVRAEPPPVEEEETETPDDILDKVGGAGLPSADLFLTELESELAHVEPHTWWLGGNDADNVRDTNENVDISEQSLFAQMLTEPDDAHITFRRVGTTGRVDVINDGEVVGHVIIVAGRVTELHLDNLPPEISRAALQEIVEDANTGLATHERSISGGTVDPRGVARRRYAVIAGSVPVEERNRIKQMFNADDNKHGGVLDLILVSSTGAEGLDLKNGRHIHIMEPYWNWGRAAQIIARFVRNDSHIALPADEKDVTPYIYLSIPPEAERVNGVFISTTDTEMFDKSVSEQVGIESFNRALQEVSIECLVNGGTDCKVCSPSDAALFTDDIARDTKAPDPCGALAEERVRAEEIVVNGVTYYFVADATSIYDYRVFSFDANINGHRQMSESDPLYAVITDAIAAQKTRAPPPSKPAKTPDDEAG